VTRSSPVLLDASPAGLALFEPDDDIVPLWLSDPGGGVGLGGGDVTAALATRLAEATDDRTPSRVAQPLRPLSLVMCDESGLPSWRWTSPSLPDDEAALLLQAIGGPPPTAAHPGHQSGAPAGR
jgi:hypothetical protein